MRSNFAAGSLGPLTSHRRTVSLSPGGEPHSFAQAATDTGRPIGSVKSSRSFLSSGPVIKGRFCSQRYLCSTNSEILPVAAFSSRRSRNQEEERDGIALVSDQRADGLASDDRDSHR